MDKQTLTALKDYANIMSDGSSKTFLYRKICEELEKIEGLGFEGEEDACSYCVLYQEALKKGICERGKIYSYKECGTI